MDKRSLVVAFIAGVVAAALGVVGFRAWSDARADDELRRDRREIRSYLDRVEPLAREGGEIVAV